MTVTRREFMGRTIGAAALTAVVPRRVFAQENSDPFVLLIGGLCFHDSDEDDDYRIWMPKFNPAEPHHAVLIKKKSDTEMSGEHPRNDVGSELESVSLDGCEVTVTSVGTNTKYTADNGELKFSYQLPYPSEPGVMTSWSSLDWFVPCRKFLNNKLAGMEQRRKNSEALVHLTSGNIGAIWPVGETNSSTGGQDVKLWEVSVGGEFKAVRAIPNWALAQLPGNSCVLKLKDLCSQRDLGSITLTGEAAIAFLPAVKPRMSMAGQDPTKHFKLFDPILKPHKDVTIVHRGATFPLKRVFTPHSFDERVSHFLDRVECLAQPQVISRSTGGPIGIRTAGSSACPPSHDP